MSPLSVTHIHHIHAQQGRSFYYALEWINNYTCHHWYGRIVLNCCYLSAFKPYHLTLLFKEMIRINYHCGFLDEKRSLFVFSNKTKDEEVSRLTKLNYKIYSIEETKWHQHSSLTSSVSMPKQSVLSNNMLTHYRTKQKTNAKQTTP